MKKEKEISIIRFSAAEYLTLITATGESDVNAYLDFAELRAEEQIPMTMEDWAEQFEGILKLSKKEILTHAGTISAQIAEQHALSEFEKYRVRQAQLYQSDFDRMLLETEEDNIGTNETSQ